MAARVAAGNIRRRGLLDEFLMAPLRRAVPGAQVHEVTQAVAEDLHLYVPGPGQIALEVALGPPERALSLPLRRLQSGGSLGRLPNHAHAPAAPAIGSLDGNRPAVRFAEGDDLIGRAQHLCGAGHPGHLRPLGGQTGADLVAHDLDRRRRRADPHDPGLGHGPGELRVLRQEPVAGVQAVRARAGRDFEDLAAVQVALGCRLPGQGVGLIGQAHVESIPVDVGVHGDGGDAEFPAGANDPDGDLPPVGDHHLAQHEEAF